MGGAKALRLLVKHATVSFIPGLGLLSQDFSIYLMKVIVKLRLASGLQSSCLSFLGAKIIGMCHPTSFSVLHICLCTTCIPDACRGQKRMLDLWGLQLYMAESLCGYWELDLGSLEEKPSLLITELLGVFVLFCFLKFCIDSL